MSTANEGGLRQAASSADFGTAPWCIRLGKKNLLVAGREAGSEHATYHASLRQLELQRATRPVSGMWHASGAFPTRPSC